ncbi:MAG: hypothetical protein FWF57_02740 [Defluviitaleaceae bacterium]|nr:hypothetical protein [Defluviitaleaceae bacterium]
METTEEILEDLDETQKKNRNWNTFIGTDVINFFNKYELEKLSLEDGNGNKAKLTRQKNEEIKVETSSITIY